MANQNSIAGWTNLSLTQSITTSATATAISVPAAGVLPGFPSITLTAGEGLFAGVPQDVQHGAFDGHPFKVRIAGTVFTGAASTLTSYIYQAPSAIVLAGTQGTLANDAVAITSVSAAITGAANFITELIGIWDSTSLKLTPLAGVNGAAGAAITPTLPGAITTVYTVGGQLPLNFVPAFAFSVANAANTVTLTEFTIERV